MKMLLWAIRRNYVLSYRLYPFYLIALFENFMFKPTTFEELDRKQYRTIFLQHIRDYMKVKKEITEKELENV